jgi:serine/threonine kinase 32
MGNCQFQSNSSVNEKKRAMVQRSHFIFHYCIGKGGFGKVWKVQMKKSQKYYALKEMLKARIYFKRSIESVINERLLLKETQSDTLVNMYFSFQDKENLYLAIDLLNGGDLRYHINKKRKFTEEQTSRYPYYNYSRILCVFADPGLRVYP